MKTISINCYWFSYCHLLLLFRPYGFHIASNFFLNRFGIYYDIYLFLKRSKLKNCMQPMQYNLFKIFKRAIDLKLLSGDNTDVMPYKQKRQERFDTFKSSRSLHSASAILDPISKMANPNPEIKYTKVSKVLYYVSVSLNQ